MKFTINQQELSAALSLVCKAAPSRPLMPILANVLVEVKAGCVQLTCFDLSLGIQSMFDAEVKEQGSIAIPAKMLSDIVSKLRKGELTIESDSEHDITLTSVSGSYHLKGADPAEYPELPSIETDFHHFPVSDFIRGLRGCIEASSDDESKQILIGVCLTVEPKYLEFAATDGHRLGRVRIDSQQSSDPFKVVIPSKALKDLEKMLTATTDEELSLRFDSGQVIFEVGLQRLCSRTLEGNYPQYQLLIPSQFQRHITIDRRQLISSLERVGIMVDGSNLVRFNIYAEANSITIKVVGEDKGIAVESLSAQIFGDDLDVGFNNKYLIEGLKLMSSEEVRINLNGHLEPVTIHPVGDMNTTYLLMPIQIKS